VELSAWLPLNPVAPPAPGRPRQPHHHGLGDRRPALVDPDRREQTRRGDHGRGPALDRDAADRRTRSAAPAASRAGVGVGAGGLALVGVAVGLGFAARSKWGTVGAHCDASHICDAEGVSINHQARLFGNIGTIVGGVGVAALIAGTVLYVTAPAARPVIEHARVEVHADSGVQIGFGGRF
jgi:hypothetical protein